MISCPNCESARIHQSRRKGIVEKVILAMLFVRPFRCERCDQRFFRRSIATEPNGSRAAVTE
jgi:predicted Zn-ribbon and HTH transcriptional regulator